MIPGGNLGEDGQGQTGRSHRDKVPQLHAKSAGQAKREELPYLQASATAIRETLSR
jgi:hypothetical protein